MIVDPNGCPNCGGDVIAGLSHMEEVCIGRLKARAEAAVKDRDGLESILRGEQAIEGAFGKTRLWGAVYTVLDVKATGDELDQIMRLLNANSKGVAEARAAGKGENGGS
jgi:hypothetical protein